MRQALHIFRKDLRFLWLPILLVLALTVVFAWSEYPSGLLSGNEELDLNRGIYHLFLVLGWLYLVAAVIYKEQPAGDRQFWVTRPYSWKSLAGAKTLFILTFINVPFFFSDIAILHAQGLPSPIPTLIGRQAVLTGVFLLPVAALASVTKHYSQIALTGFAGLLLLLFGTGFNSGSATDSWGRLEWIPASIVGALLFLSAAFVLLWQYASRRTWIARGILIAAALLCLGTPAIRPFPLAVALASHDPGPADLQAVRLAPPLHDGIDITDWAPVLTKGLPPGMSAQMDLIDFTIHAADGTSWRSGWHISGWHSPTGDLSDSTWDGRLGLDLGSRIPGRFNSQLVNIRLSVAMTIYRTGTTIQMARGGGPYKIPGVGDCSIPAIERLAVPAVFCRAVRYPAERVLVNGSPFIGEPRGYAALFDLSPVFRSFRQMGSPDSLALTPERPVAHLRRDLTLAQVHLHLPLRTQ